MNIDSITLLVGAHKTREDGLCIMEAAAWIAGEPHSDHPKCVCPVIGAFMRRWNDDLDDATRQRLKPYAQRVVGTKSTPDVESRRAWLATDWMVRTYTPAWLDLAGLKPQADALRALPEITKATAEASRAALYDARENADAALAAARAAAWAAAGAAAGAAARDAARDADRDAATSKLDSTVTSLQASAFDLLDRMIAAPVAGEKESAE